MNDFPGRGGDDLYYIFQTIRFYCPSQNKSHNTTNSHGVDARLHRTKHTYQRFIACIEQIEEEKRNGYSVKIHCVNRGLNMMDLLAYQNKTKRNETQDINNNSHAYAFTEPFY